jgi:hypothetical protein
MITTRIELLTSQEKPRRMPVCFVRNMASSSRQSRQSQPCRLRRQKTHASGASNAASDRASVRNVHDGRNELSGRRR